MSIKTLPHSAEAEKEVLGSIVNDSESITEVIDIISVGDFYSSQNQIIYTSLVDMFQRNIPIDIVTLTNTLGQEKLQSIGGISYLSELIGNNLSSVNIKAHAEIIKEKAERRQVIKAARDAMEEAYDDSKEVKSVIACLEDKLLNVGFENENKVLTDEELMDLTINTIQKAYEKGGEITGMSTGMESLDLAINGINKGDLIVIAGRPSMGKTVFALNIASNMAKDKKVAIFELEMKAEKLGIRRLAAQSLINATHLGRGKLNDKQWQQAVSQANKISIRNNIFTDTSPGITMAEIKAKSRKIKLKWGLDAIIIDHIGLVKPTNPNDTRTNIVAEISRHAKIIAKELGVAVIILSQLTRECEKRPDKRPMLSDLRESGAIEQDGDLIIFLYRDEYYNKESEDRGIIESIIAKQRDGKTGVIKLAYMPEYQLITDLKILTKGDER